MQEARNAGVWAVGVVNGSSMLGLTKEEAAAMEPDMFRKCALSATQQFMDSGAHYVIEQISDLPDIIEKVNRRIEEGDLPCGH
ncbi:Phosphonoacetaldehyde hydrolase [compost metagenome]